MWYVNTALRNIISLDAGIWGNFAESQHNIWYAGAVATFKAVRMPGLEGRPPNPRRGVRPNPPLAPPMPCPGWD